MSFDLAGQARNNPDVESPRSQRGSKTSMDIGTKHNRVGHAQQVLRPAWDLPRHAFGILIRLLAPVAPSFAEECWINYIGRDDPQQTAFATGFPQPDGSLEKLQSQSMTCSVQINGKFRFAAQITPPPTGLAASELQELVLDRAFASEEGVQALQKWQWDLSKAKKGHRCAGREDNESCARQVSHLRWARKKKVDHQ
ncbi:hypothetical protein MRB53_038726 [Persea americana]|nr:hypothetical protein MRB53_038726 [Persea americana]